MLSSTVSLPVESDDNTLLLAIGTLSLSASIGLFFVLLKNHNKIAKWQKYDFYNYGNNAIKLNEYNKYENSLAGISKKKRIILRNIDNPKKCAILLQVESKGLNLSFNKNI